ncbi:MAG: hypothetical protein KBT09_05485, partial [Bacteroidales bacterium]|nr:hypothetical protein [Candidatus Sodaliphilus fimicaballi]
FFSGKGGSLMADGGKAGVIAAKLASTAIKHALQPVAQPRTHIPGVFFSPTNKQHIPTENRWTQGL